MGKIEEKFERYEKLYNDAKEVLKEVLKEAEEGMYRHYYL